MGSLSGTQFDRRLSKVRGKIDDRVYDWLVYAYIELNLNYVFRIVCNQQEIRGYAANPTGFRSFKFVNRSFFQFL